MVRSIQLRDHFNFMKINKKKETPVKKDKVIRGNYHVHKSQKEKVYRLSQIGSVLNKTSEKISESEIVRILIDKQHEN